MRVIQLQSVANQQFSVRLDSDRYEITFKETNGVMSVTIVRNDEIIVSNIRCVGGTPLIPYRYKANGNFMFLTENQEIPYWTKFQTNQSLIYITADEIAGL